MISKKDTEFFLEKSKVETTEERISHKIMSASLSGIKCAMFSKKEIGKNAKEFEKNKKLLEENGFTITVSNFDENDIYVSWE